MLRVSGAGDLSQACHFSQFDSCGFIDKSLESSRWVIVSQDTDSSDYGWCFCNNWNLYYFLI